MHLSCSELFHEPVEEKNSQAVSSACYVVATLAKSFETQFAFVCYTLLSSRVCCLLWQRTVMREDRTLPLIWLFLAPETSTYYPLRLDPVFQPYLVQSFVSFLHYTLRLHFSLPRPDRHKCGPTIILPPASLFLTVSFFKFHISPSIQRAHTNKDTLPTPVAPVSKTL